MPNVGPIELAVVLIVALVVFGPKRLPELGKSAGRGIREFRQSIRGTEVGEPERAPAAPTELDETLTSEPVGAEDRGI